MMEHAKMETLVSASGGDEKAIINTYTLVIQNVLERADRILETLKGVEPDDKTTLANIVTSLHNLVDYARRYGFYDCVHYASSRGDIYAVEDMFRHPLLKIILLYLSVVSANDRIYLDWKIEISFGRKPLFGKRPVGFRITYDLSRMNPVIGDVGLTKIQEEKPEGDKST